MPQDADPRYEMACWWSEKRRFCRWSGEILHDSEGWKFCVNFYHPVWNWSGSRFVDRTYLDLIVEGGEPVSDEATLAELLLLGL